MNTTEHLVEVYYRQQGHFTASDIKVVNGNNRQMDLLTFSPKDRVYRYIEISVAHGQHWARTLDQLKDHIRYKFFGSARNSRPGLTTTDFAKGKSYLNAIKATYEKYGVSYDEVVRVWCTWCLPENDKSKTQWQQELAQEFDLQPRSFDILLLFRDEVFPALLKNIGTAFYDDQLLRTLSLIKEYNRQSVG